MNITSASPPGSLTMGAFSKNNLHKLEDLKKVYAEAMIQEYNQQKKPKNKIRIKSRQRKNKQTGLSRAVSMPLRTQMPFRTVKEIKIANLNALVADDSTTHLPQQHNPQNIRRELLFLRDIVSKRKDGANLASSHSESQLEKRQSVSSMEKKNALEGKSMRSTSFGFHQKVNEYVYYDTVVRDLLEEIKVRKQNDVKTSRPTISPSKYSQAKQKSICQKPEIPDFRSIIKVQPKKQNMIFRMTDFVADNVYQKKITSYINFLYKVNFSNSIYFDLSLNSPSKTYKVKIGSGNNCQLIKSLVKRRFWLEITPNSGSQDSEITFVWTQNTLENYHRKQEQRQGKGQVIEPQKQEKIFRKLKKIKNAKKQVQIDINEKILRKKDIYEAESNYYASNNGCFSIHRKDSAKIVTNHIPHNYIIGSKKILFMLMHWYYQDIKKEDPFVILPKTYHIRSGEVNNAAFKNFLQCEGDKPDKVWIIKPGENTNRGNGINVASLNEVSKLIRRREVHKNGEEKTYIIQRYLKPFLYSGRKFDIRHYLLITSVNGYIKGYWYKEGYIRTSSEKYDLDDLSNQFVHLTNDAIQKRSEYYGKYQEGNKVSYSNFQRYLDQTHPQKKYSFQNQILKRMKEITKEMMEASFSFMDPHRKSFNFELFGMDFMIDSKFRPYLIQVNANPCLETSCTLLQRIIPILTEHTFRLALDPLLPPPDHYPPNTRFQLSDRIMQKLKYQLIFDQKYQGMKIREEINKCEVKFHLDPKSVLEPDEQIFDNDGEELKDLLLD